MQAVFLICTAITVKNLINIVATMGNIIYNISKLVE